MVAGDSQWQTEGSLIEPGPPKLRRYREFVAGFAGTMPDITKGAEWLSKRPQKRPRLSDFSALLVFRDGRLFEVHEDLVLHEIDADYAAIGAGRAPALSAMDTMEILGVPIDPRIAIQVAIRRNTSTGGQIHSLRWKRAYP